METRYVEDLKKELVYKYVPGASKCNYDFNSIKKSSIWNDFRKLSTLQWLKNIIYRGNPCIKTAELAFASELLYNNNIILRKDGSYDMWSGYTFIQWDKLEELEGLFTDDTYNLLYLAAKYNIENVKSSLSIILVALLKGCCEFPIYVNGNLVTVLLSGVRPEKVVRDVSAAEVCDANRSALDTDVQELITVFDPFCYNCVIGEYRGVEISLNSGKFYTDYRKFDPSQRREVYNFLKGLRDKYRNNYEVLNNIVNKQIPEINYYY